MLLRAVALALPVSVTLSGAWTPSFLSVFPFVLPVLVLLVGARFRVDTVPLAFVIVAVLAIASATYTGANLGFGLLWLALAGLYLVARDRVSEVLSPEAMTRAMTLAACAVAAIALYQVATSSLSGTPYGALASQMQLGLTTSGDSLIQRPVGVFHNSNVLGQWLVFAALMILPMAHTLRRAWRWSAGALVFSALVLTYSRAVWVVVLGVSVWLAVRWILRSESRTAIACVLTSLAGLAALFVGVPRLPSHLLPDRFGWEEATQQWTERGTLNEAGLSVASEHPWAGVGYLEYAAGPADGLRPHNVFVQVAAEQGVPVAAALGVAVFVVAMTCWRAARQVRRSDPRLGGALAALPIAWIGFLVTYSSAADFAVMPVFVLAVGWLVSLAARSAAVADAPRPAASGRVRGVLLIAVSDRFSVSSCSALCLPSRVAW